MNNHRALTFSFFTVALGLLLAAPAAAQTECQPDDLFCAEVRIGPGRAGVRVGGGDPQPQPPPPPPQPEPEPPTVIVQPAPPPQPPPQPPTVVVQPQPQPQPRPQVVQVQPAPQPQPQPVQQQPERRRRFPYSAVGVHLHLSGLFGDELAMGGAGGAFRIRPNPWFALDLGGSVYHGNDYNGLERTELPVTADALFFFNPHHRFQFYALAGVGASWAYAEGQNRFTRNYMSREYAHLGGSMGLGLEWRISRVFALNMDVRGFVRQRVDDNPEPEFAERTDTGGFQSTDTSGGVVGQLGMTFYFGR